MNQIAETLFYPHFSPSERIGAEIEIFIVNQRTKKRLFVERDRQFFQDFFDFLLQEGFEQPKDTKTILFHRSDFGEISFESGSQIEFSSLPFSSAEELEENIRAFYTLFERFIAQSFYRDIKLFHKGHFIGVESAERIPIITNERYSIIYDYFAERGDYADDITKFICALQIHFDFASEKDLVDKVNRILLAKPILLYLSSSSPCPSKSCYSYREEVWQKSDPIRTGTAGGEEIYTENSWSLDSYIKKILDAPRIFPADQQLDFYENLDFHISTMWTDVRVRKTIEIRYLDCPKKDLLFPLIQLTHSLIYDQQFWSKFEALLPYEFHQIPEICRAINHGTEHATVLWKDVFAVPFIQLLESYGRKKGIDFSTIIDKVNSYECLVNSEVIEQELAVLYSMP